MRYEVTGMLVDGPVFTTYSARDRQAGREVCIRLLKPPFNKEVPFVLQLKMAVKKYSAIQSPNIEQLAELDESDGTVFMVGDLTRGPSLADRIRKLAPFSIPVSVGMAISICQALDAMHRAGFTHGDISPQNIAVLADGDARLQMAGVWEAYSGSPTAGSLVLPGMAPYLAPEVSGGDMPSALSDVYAVGVMLFELLSGRQPYVAETALATAVKHRTQPTPSVRSFNPSVPDVLDRIVRKAMEKEPGDRYRTAGELLADLRVMQDALRFGKSLSWPLAGDGRQTRAQEPKPVAPRMSAIRSASEVEELPKRARHDRDVPVWMLIVITALGAIVCSLVVVWFFFVLNKPKQITVPNVRGLTVEEARGMLSGDGLDLRIGQRVANERVPADHIIDVNPSAGGKVREGAQVYATISLGSKYVEAPDVRGLTLDKARSVLQSIDLEVEEPPLKVASSTVAIGDIARQSPPPRQKVERLSRVRVYISTGAPAGGVDPAVPDTTPPQFLYRVQMKVSLVPSPVVVRIDIIDQESDQGRTVFNEKHAAGDAIDFTTRSTSPEATFVIYYDDAEVKRVQKTAEGAER